MGFTSWDCPGCNHSVRHPGATNKTSRWMANAIAIFPNGDRVSGTYDGYGHVGGTELEYGTDFALYHKSCWEILGKPEYEKPSESAHDQGHFVGQFDPVMPTTKDDLVYLKGRKK